MQPILDPGIYEVRYVVAQRAVQPVLQELIEITEIICCGVEFAFSPRLCMNDAPFDLGSSVNITGATTYTATWSPDTYITNANTLNATFTPPSPGLYTLTLEIDNTGEGGCITPRQVTYEVVNVTATGQTFATSCPGTCDGSAQVTGTFGGISPYTINWSNGGSGTSITGLCPGTYTATVQETGGCATQVPLQVIDVPPFVLDAGFHNCNSFPLEPGDCFTLPGNSFN
jgi:hypothetical protein